MKKVTFLFLILIALYGNVYSQISHVIAHGPKEKEFAQKSLNDYIKNLITEENFIKFGFKTLEEANSAKVGDPIPMVTIGLKDLKQAKDNSIETLAIIAKKLWFPVMVNGDVRAKIEILQKNERWIAGEYGTIKSAKIISDEIIKLPKLLEEKHIQKPDQLILLEIPSLSLDFLYVDSKDGKFMVPAATQPERFDLSNGELYNASDVIKNLRERVKDIDENKVM